MTDTNDSVSSDSWVAVIPVPGDVLHWSATILSFSEACDEVIICGDARVATETATVFEHQPNVRAHPGPLSEILPELCFRTRACVVVREPCVVTPDAFVRARQIVADDIRIATLSFFSNDADYLSVPERNHPLPMLSPGLTETTSTRLLRSDSLLDRLVPIPVPAGPAVAVTATALRSLGTLVPDAPSIEFALVDFALRASRRSMRNVLDPSTLVLRTPGEVTHYSVLRTDSDRSRLNTMHPHFPSLYDDVKADEQGPLAGAISLARTAMQGMSVLIDASAVGPFEMGTQVQILNLIQALARHDYIRKVIVGMIGQPPPYALPYLDAPKIKVAASISSDFQVDERVDILHRPCQPDGDIPWDRWRSISDRIVVTIQDLIAYNNGSYFVDPSIWRQYRAGLVQSIHQADGVAVVSDDVARSIADERLPVSPENVCVIWNGVDHELGRFDASAPPGALVTHGFAASSFILVLGATYAHKNRDVAIEAWKILRNRGLPHRLVMAGVVVPRGSTRNEEARARSVLPENLRHDLLTVPDVTPDERTWLLTHSSLVMYPTSAEGFGLIPFETAQCGTPTLFVSFGPLAELVSSTPVVARDWSPGAFADAAQLLLEDPGLASAQVEAVRAAAKKYTWTATADQSVRFYRELLARPAIGRIARV
ncbi:MAG: glycosyltransferase [Actinomycetota bacterium]|nr:glycosyltransferase [Actinomycetota bacterium]